MSTAANTHPPALTPDSKQTTAEILRRAKALITDPSKWTQGEYARDSSGISVYPRIAEAACWCAAGAIRKVISYDGSAIDNIKSREMARKLLAQFVGDDIVGFNDSHTHAEVMEAFDKAIAKAEVAHA